MTAPYALGAEIRLPGECETCLTPVLKIVDRRVPAPRYVYPYDAAGGGGMYRCRCGDLIAESWRHRPASYPQQPMRLLLNGIECIHAGSTAAGETVWAIPGGGMRPYGDITRIARLNGWKVEFVEQTARKK